MDKKDKERKSAINMLLSLDEDDLISDFNFNQIDSEDQKLISPRQVNSQTDYNLDGTVGRLSIKSSRHKELDRTGLHFDETTRSLLKRAPSMTIDRIS